MKEIAPVPVTEVAAYGLRLRPVGSRRTFAPIAADLLRTITLSPVARADLPPLPDSVPVAAWHRAAATPQGWQIDVVDAVPGGFQRCCSVVLSEDGTRLHVSDTYPDGAHDRWTVLTHVAIRSILARLGAPMLHGNLSLGPTGAVAVLGDSGAGKSSLAIALMRAGAPPLADDVVCPVRMAGGWYAWPGHHEILAEGPTLDRLGIDRTAWPTLWQNARPDEQKYRLTANRRPETVPDAARVPLAGIVVLEPRRPEPCRPTLHRLAPAAAMAAIVPHGQWGAAGSSRQARLAELASLASEVPIWRLSRSDRIEDLAATAELVLGTIGDARI
ncbi:hypothetical protein ABIE65_004071 [Constrictibacter sp. MBR-5]|uniref:hypothetical protein n=1 Tax=Constrictibacter sp. MBR-5 TaxID=3156467 RepID=UPI0033917D3C